MTLGDGGATTISRAKAATMVARSSAAATDSGVEMNRFT